MTDEAAPPTRYACRKSLFGAEPAFELTPDGLLFGGRTLDYRTIDRVRLYQVRAQDGTMIKRCKLHGEGRTLVLQSTHFARWGSLQDRSAQFLPFVQELLVRVARVNPGLLLASGMHWTSRAGWLLVLVTVAVLALAGIGQLAGGDWEGLWLLGLGMTTGPLALVMASSQPVRHMSIKEVAEGDGFSSRFG